MATSSGETLSKLIKERGYVKASLTSFKTFCDTHGRTIAIASLQERFNRNVPLIDRFERVQEQIMDIVAGTADEEVHEQYKENFETLYFDVIGTVRSFIQRSQAPVASSNANQSIRNINTSPAVSSAAATVKLPSIPLPTFHGSLGEWVYFRDSFESLINQNESLSNIERFHYLKSAVRGEAARALEALAMSDDNYNAAWKLLRDRYEDTNELIDYHVGAVFNLQPTARDSTGLRRLIDDFNNHLRSLTSLQEPVDKWDTLLVYLLSNKLDARTREAWEKRVSELGRRKTLVDLRAFLEQHHKFIAKSVRGNSVTSLHQTHSRYNHQKPPSRPVSLVSAERIKCPLCTDDHGLAFCKAFKSLHLEARRSKVRELRACYNCLRTGHCSKTCTYGSCRKCRSKHHTLLHYDRESERVASPAAIDRTGDDTNHENQSYTVHSATDSDLVLLSTAIVHVIDAHGKKHECRALLDQGSQVNILKEECAARIGLTWDPTQAIISGVGAAESGNRIRGKTQTTIASRYNGYRTHLPCLIMKKITSDIPNFKLSRSLLQIPSHIRLADPQFDVPRDVDLIIGNGYLWDIISVGQHRLGPGLPVLLKTQLGWVFGGRVRGTTVSKPHMCNVVTNEQLNNQLTRFWEIETLPEVEEALTHPCEARFMQTVRRNSDGRFIVEIPVTNDVTKLGDSKVTAEGRFRNLEGKLSRSPSLKQAYVSFIQEYIALGHMSKLPRYIRATTNPVYYLPHHAVTKEASTTTKVRVVFDGSAKTSTGISLNEAQYVGPTVQDDLFSILIRFRQHCVVISADIAKMYRQILVAPEQRSLQRILWREDPSQPIDVYELNTVTYGTASAPFLATRCLRQVGIDNQEKYPIASKIIISDFYVDDLLTGANSVEEAQLIKRDIEGILKTVGFELRKWASNEPTVVQRNTDTTKAIVSQAEKDPKTLGLLWAPTSDDLRIVGTSQMVERVTKRTILSHLAKMFDPLGLVGPVTVRAKIMMQALWQLGLTWDESVPQQIHTEFQEFQSELESLSRLSIPRFTLCPNSVKVELHGFCDASEKAFGACIYLRTTDQAGHFTVRLLCAKSRVAPLKKISLPRLELCAALLLVQVSNKVRAASHGRWHREFYWTDSMITLAWIKGSSSRWKTFVANRVSEIQNLSQGSWQHVASEHNPADCLSRGVRPSTLEALSLWWTGPSWLQQKRERWPISKFVPVEILEEKTVVCATLQIENCSELLTRYSDYTRLIRVIAYCLKFYRAVSCRRLEPRKDTAINPTASQARVKTHNLTVSDLNLAEICILRVVQGQHFMSEVSDLKTGKDISNSSPLRCLNPFLDEKKLLRVGGRLNFAKISYEHQHPVILPKDNAVTRLIIRREHERMLHAGCESVLSAIRRKYWPLKARNLIKGILKTCVRCTRTNPRGTGYLMGQLPSARVRLRAPFFCTGVDYAGPFYVKERSRSKTTTKAYLCLFVCLATKAVHFELSVDLSTDAFLNSLRRFIARRGRCREIYSDNGTNFVGGHNEIQRIQSFLRNELNQRRMSEFAVTEGLDWHFIPPHAPHFGGLWESAVKSAKRHLLRVIGDTRLTFEELYTVLTQVEACMNSRPLSPVSTDPTDLNPLTPGHFLTGGPLSDIPYPDVTDVKVNRLSRFQLLQAMYQHFWRRWQHDYLHHLQQRHKWKTTVPEHFGLGTMVVIKEDNLPPLRWKLGRITEMHQGKDGVTRVVSIRTVDGVIKRPVTKICILPVDTGDPTTAAQSDGPDQPGPRIVTPIVSEQIL